MEKFKGYEVVDEYPKDGWLRGFFYVRNEDIKGHTDKSCKAYQDLAYIKHKDYVLHLLDIKKGERVLDVGCSDGALMVYCGLLGAEAYGIDIHSESIHKANKYINKYGINGKALLCDARRIIFKDNYFDKVVSSDFFEHISDKDSGLILKEIKRVLKPGGIAVIKTPNLIYLKFSRLIKQMIQLLNLRNPFDIVIPHTIGDNPDHIGLKTSQGLVKIIKSAGFYNFKFYYGINSKIERISYALGDVLSQAYILRDIYTEELIAVVYKPIILSFLN